MARETRDWYDTPLYYDIIFDAGTAREAAFLDGLWRRHGRPNPRARSTPRVLEAACGSGRVMAEMLRHGWRADGFDLNEAMLSHARERLRREHGAAGWRVWRDELASFNPPAGRRYHLAHCLVSTFKYLLTEADARACLTRLAAALEPGGLLVLGLHLTDYTRATCEHERWAEERDGVRVVCNTRTWPPHRRKRLEQVRARLRVTQQGRTREQETVWPFRTYNAAQLKALLSSVPQLEIVCCHDFTYDLDAERPLDDSYADIVVVLRRVEANPFS